ncbi:MAG: carboxymuconolactone decarboxylase family protein [Acidimicrobiales bacterium]
MGGPAEVLRRSAPQAGAALDEVATATWEWARGQGRVDLVGLAGRICAAQMDLQPLAPPPGTGPLRWADVAPDAWRSIDQLTEADAVALRFAEQFSADVTGITEEQRRSFVDHFAAAAGDFAAVLFALDFLPRTNAALLALFDGGDHDGDGSKPVSARARPLRASGSTVRSALWESFGNLTRAVARLGSLDPVTTELVRLRGARQHRCRLCASLRSRPAIRAGADEALLGAVDHRCLRDLTPEHRAALELTDAMIWTPGRIAEGVLGDLRVLFSEEAQVELVLDVTRNAFNKVAVALGADDAHVTSGVELYDFDDDGEVVYGVSLD